MTAGWVLPRDWDGARLLRFLAGLAMLALAFAANAGLIATPAAAAPAAPAEVSVVDVSVVDAPVAEAPAPAVRPMAIVAVIGNGKPALAPALIADPAGDLPGSPGSRAPPTV